ncbi:MAG: hypothetical protein LUC88_04495 [Prevotella sp.]|nr:hypothetical protein [Prevotella sp.]
METDVKNINLTDYYRNLRRKDKTKLVDFLSKKYDMNRNTLMMKLLGFYNTHLNKCETIIIQNEIKEGKWNDWNLEQVLKE